MLKSGVEYAMAIQLVHYQEALNKANQCLANSGQFGIIPNSSVSFRKDDHSIKKLMT